MASELTQTLIAAQRAGTLFDSSLGLFVCNLSVCVFHFLVGWLVGPAFDPKNYADFFGP